MITIEISGPRGSGKTTALRIIAKALAQYQPGLDIILFDEDYKSRGRPVRAVDPSGSLQPCKVSVVDRS